MVTRTHTKASIPMNARLERKLRLLAGVVVAGALAGVIFGVVQGHTFPAAIVAGVAYGVINSAVLGSLELFVLQGPMNRWLSDLSFTASLAVRSAIYAVIIVLVQGFRLG